MKDDGSVPLMFLIFGIILSVLAVGLYRLKAENIKLRKVIENVRHVNR